MIDTGGAATLDGDVKLINGIEVLTGMITQGCVLHTHADALMQGFYPVVAGEGVGAYEQDWHELAMRWMARKSPVYSVSEISAEWSAPRTPE